MTTVGFGGVIHWRVHPPGLHVALFSARIRERAMLRRVTLYDFEQGAALR